MITLESVFSKRNQKRAIDTISIRKNGAGTDKAPMDEFLNNWNLNQERILEEIRNETYTPNVVREYEIVNGKGKHRNVSRYEDIDFYITRLLSQKLSEFYTPRFLPSSHAYQPDKGILTAVEQAKSFVEGGLEYVVEIDIKSFFDDIIISRVLELLQADKHDKRVITLIGAYLNCLMSRDGEIRRKEKGLVQGSSMSPVLSNLYLQALDEFMTVQQYNWIRFADDICIYVNSVEAGVPVYNVIKQMLSDVFGLTVNEQKSGIFEVYDRRLLGYDFYKKGKSLRVEKHSYKENSYFRNWHECAIEKINKEYHLVSSGVLNKKDYALIFENEEKKHHIPVEATEQLDVYNEVTITSAVFRTLNYEKVRLGVYDKYGDLVGYFIPDSYAQDSKTILAQCVEYTDEKKRLAVAKKIEIAAIHNLRANVRYYNKHKQGELTQTADALTQGIVKMNSCKSVEELLLEEARCRQTYYQSFNVILKNRDFVFEKRSKRPPLDNINALISFGNTLLYNRVQQIIWKTSLDSRIGIFHAANKRHHSLNLDFADLFKPVTVDRVIFSLINRGQLTKNHFIQKEDGSVYLDEKGKRLFIQSFNEKMGSKLTVGAKQVTYHQLIDQEVRGYLKHLLQGEKYKPYKYY